jgi:hypothetical protein
MKANLCRTRAAMAAIMVVGMAMTADAQTVLIDFGNNIPSFRGIPVPNPDPNGNTWNSLQPGLFYTNLVDTSNSATTIDFGFSTGVGTDSYNGPAGAVSFPAPTPAEIAATDIDAAALGNLGVIEAAFDYANSPSPGSPARFEIQQLDPAKTYNLTFYASQKFAADSATLFSVYSDNTYTTLVGSVSLNHQDPGSPWLHNRDKVATISGLAPQTSNILYVQFQGAGGNTGFLNSMQITAVPEPATMALVALAFGLIGCVGRRR